LAGGGPGQCIGVTEPEGRASRLGARAMALAEDVLYVGIATLLTATGLVLLWFSAVELVDLVRGGTANGAVEVLDTLLLLFIVVELQFAVRATLARRELVAEPFLLVGILASIKEIVVLSVKAAEEVGRGAAFTDRLTQIGLLGGLVLLLGATAWLMRLKEREPDEGDQDGPTVEAAEPGPGAGRRSAPEPAATPGDKVSAGG
jgi:uncharacterized membrane protein (DUF373 family)